MPETKTPTQTQNTKPDRTYPCCMCPATYSDFNEDVCDPCGFIKTFNDDRGWTFFVRGGIGENSYKAFYWKPDSRRTKGCTMVPWRKSFAEAQIDLNLLGKKKGWKEREAK